MCKNFILIVFIVLSAFGLPFVSCTVADESKSPASIQTTDTTPSLDRDADKEIEATSIEAIKVERNETVQIQKDAGEEKNIEGSSTPEVKQEITPDNNSEEKVQATIDNLDESETTYIHLEKPAEKFSISTSNHTTPEDILREVRFTGEPGGGGFGPEKPCKSTSLTIVNFLSSDESFYHYKEDIKILEWQEQTYLLTCGWQPNESVRLTIQSSDNKLILEDSLQSSSGGWLSYAYSPDFNTAPGLYTLSFDGDKEKIQQSINITRPTGPRVYRHEDKLILYNFQPKEQVRILVYYDTLTLPGNDLGFLEYGIRSLIAWQEFQVDIDGQLIIQLGDDTTSNDINVVVAGDLSGEVPPYPYTNVHRISSVLSPYSVRVLRPTRKDLQDTRNLWDLITYRDLKQPGTQTYNVALSSTDTWRWGFSWCAVNASTLQEILRPMSVKFFIDGVELSDIRTNDSLPGAQIASYGDIASNGWVCQNWLTVLSDWPPNGSVELEIRYRLTESIFDGNENYPPGEYQQVIIVDVD